MLCVVAAATVLMTLVQGFDLLRTMGCAVPLLTAVLIARRPRFSRQVRSLACSFGLLTVAALGLHLAGGRIEAHFSFFVLVVLLTLYEDWLVFAMAIGYTLVHHGVLGTIAPQQVFPDSDQSQDPWEWASIQALFIAATSVAGGVAWRLNEDVRARMRVVQDELAVAADTDVLTGLGNRRRLLSDLEGRIGVEGARLSLFDLDGFKSYNDTFGHHAGDLLLERLGRRLDQAVGEHGRAYRLGGDEFCVLLGGRAPVDVLANAVAALREHGEEFTIGASYGTVELGHEAQTAEEALQLADGRMYDQKNSGRKSAGRQSTDVLLRALAERDPDLGLHVGGVGETATEVAILVGVAGTELEIVAQAAELHDIGKVAVPDTILHKPAPLTEDEWAFMRTHTIIGERILAAAPALTQVARIVRSSHERWDGGGYPDGLAGEEIPLAARIVAVCDAFDAMITDRSYRAARSYDEAVGELRRCSGTQFDPAIVEAFVEVLCRPEPIPTGSRVLAA